MAKQDQPDSQKFGLLFILITLAAALLALFSFIAVQLAG